MGLSCSVLKASSHALVTLAKHLIKVKISNSVNLNIYSDRNERMIIILLHWMITSIRIVGGPKLHVICTPPQRKLRATVGTLAAGSAAMRSRSLGRCRSCGGQRVAAMRVGGQVNGMLLEGKKVYVGPFMKRSDRPGDAEVRFTNVFVKNLADTVIEEALDNLFGEHGTVTSVVIMKVPCGFCILLLVSLPLQLPYCRREGAGKLSLL